LSSFLDFSWGYTPLFTVLCGYLTGKKRQLPRHWLQKGYRR
jgi:hypothetical protein